MKSHLGFRYSSTILFHVYTKLTEYEQQFWSEVRSSLNQHGTDLFLVGDASNNSFIDVPYSQFLPFLDQYPNRLPLFFTQNIERDFPLESSIDFFLTREREWGRPVNRKQALKSISFLFLLYQNLIAELNPKLVILMNGQHVPELILKEICQTENIPFLLLERGPFPFSLHLDQKGITGSSELAGKTIDQLVANMDGGQDKFLSYQDHYLQERQTWWEQPENKGNIKHDLAIPHGKKIILFANQLDNDTSNFMHAPLHSDNLSALKWLTQQLIPYKDQVFLLGKHHPKNEKSPEEFQQVISKIGRWVTDYPLEECLEVADRVASVNSTVLFEALIYEKPVLQIGKSLLSNKDIAYEVKSLDKLTVQKVISEWLEATAFDDKLKNWHILGTAMLSKCLFFLKKPSGLELPGAKDFAKKILSTSGIDWQNWNHSSDLPLTYLYLTQIQKQFGRVGRMKKSPEYLSRNVPITTILEVLHQKIRNKFKQKLGAR